jgi:cell division GTPase FtsZ
MLAINEIKTFDVNTGGNTHAIIIGKQGLKELSMQEAKNLYNEFRSYVANEISQRVGITIERAMRLFPEP